MTGSPSARIAAEFVGTAFLLTAIVGSGIMAERLAGNNAAIALLANSVATGAALYVLLTAFGPVSGAHFNPAMTLAFLLNGELDRRLAGAYLIAQLGGGILGTFVAHLMFGLPLFELSIRARTGGGQWLAEMVATFGLVLFVLLVRRPHPGAVAATVALYIMAAYWFTASTSFANPAVTIARMFTDSFAGIRPIDAPMFIAAQCAGALAALALDKCLFGAKSAGVGRGVSP